jgi:hypothetical protein
MPTAKQTAANRMNSQKPSEPRTTAGKTSRYNAVKHGIVAVQQIMFDESAEDLADLAAEYHEHHSPADPDQRLLVDTLIANEWRLRRMRRVEAVLWEHAADSFLAQHPEAEACNSAHAFTTNAGYFERLQRMVNGCERNYHRALKELQHQQVARAHGLLAPESEAGPAQAAAHAPQSPQTQQSTTTSANLVSFRQNPKTAESAATQTPAVNPDAALYSSPPAPSDPARAHAQAQNCQNMGPAKLPENV